MEVNFDDCLNILLAQIVNLRTFELETYEFILILHGFSIVFLIMKKDFVIIQIFHSSKKIFATVVGKAKNNKT